MTTDMKDTDTELDYILDGYIGRLETYKKVHKGLPEHVTRDEAYAKYVTKQSIQQLIKRETDKAALQTWEFILGWCDETGQPQFDANGIRDEIDQLKQQQTNGGSE